ncbi:A disintegrin and metalloproteinase with thrombospondin motifs 20-like [Ruditapes philippinarum]|uniref:A disintegrin and metalloproteinase with thrombospondin motifs 20-like n=1 Tax=Ruditapes philippinarum TaxID=129788 RepID=UPI00295B4037|nr:A disintegrin and metalloproteinase with thrombospondin motifs 20-like [Ruditapes philippinarum]
MKDMTVNKGDTTFAEIVGAGTSYVSYAQAETCNCNWGCKHGTFSISTEGTGFKFSSSLSVSGFGWQPYVGPLTKNNDNTKMSATCGGYCGGCEPSGSLYLYHDENTVVDESSAVLAKCV